MVLLLLFLAGENPAAMQGGTSLAHSHSRLPVLGVLAVLAGLQRVILGGHRR